MLGLFGTLNLGARSLQAQQTGIEVTGQNLANVNNSAYARQRVQIQTSATLQSSIGSQGTGADAVAIQQLRSSMLDGQITSEASVGGYWDAQQGVLQQAEALLGEELNTNGTSSSGLAQRMNDFFSALQSVATSPESLTERQNLIAAAQNMAESFNQVGKGLSELRNSLNSTLASDVSSANQLLADIAKLNNEVAGAEMGGGTANDLRDLRQQKLEELAGFVSFDSSTAMEGSVNISIAGTQMVSGNQVLDTLQITSGLLTAASSGAGLNPAGGSMRGTIDARDGALFTLQTKLNDLARTIALRTQNVHSTGYNLAGNTGSDFFGGLTAATLTVVMTDPALFQASGSATNNGDNSVALRLAQQFQGIDDWLGSQVTYTDFYSGVVAKFGTSLDKANDQRADFETVNAMLLKQRDSVSGVSIDEEMTSLITYQKAYQASAKIVSTVAEMLDTIINMKR